ncbi:MAG TPA: WYL domain-containing protein [Pseudidiomarina sp.]|nr:WYL domain-containing protein [Pseudidiomarina sp.]
MPGPTSHHRNDNKEVVLRCIYMLLALYERQRTVTELLEVLADRELKPVSERTIQRDLDTLDGHFGLHQAGKQGRATLWAVDPVDFEELLELEDPVALALVVAEQQLDALGPMHTFDAVKPLFERARQQLAHRDTPASRWLQRVCVTSAGHRLLGPNLSAELNDRLQDVALRQAAVKLNYHRHQGDPAQTIEATALGMFYRGSVSYLIIRQRANGRIRQLPFSRISHIQESVTFAADVGDFQLKDYAHSGALAFRFGEPFRLKAVVFNSVRREIEDAPLGSDQELHEIPGQPYNRQLEVTVPYTLNLIQWLLARAPYLKVIGPDDFRERFKQELEQALRNMEAEHLEVPTQRSF